ncbi:MFS transporter [Saccharopolyspora flava]|uniref:MFS transporter, DHA1 family, arabinose polymer transporter n=1 Tax=Saccharopolyspora flava TaxID=95161 RepID=A0A1I6SBQ3_9PSEU|nr:MFS transporter [Saccharopolyspora flava]SFS74391.1 MFS transporter, DHA1 family, arabinose polymer transporter [Saccharopolyspora flava]
MPFPIVALALTAFALGTAELVPNGLLPLISADLAIPVSTAGWVTTSFALGAVIGGPLVAAATLRLPRKPLVIGLTLVFLVANAITALSASLPVIALSRALAGAMLGGFLGTAITVARGLVAPSRQATAIAVVFTGFTVSNVIAVPIGNLAGRAVGWEAAFWVVSLLAAVGVLAMWLVLPSAPGGGEAEERGFGVLRNGRLWTAFLAIALGYGGLFVVYTYIAPYLTSVTGVSQGSVTWLLLLFGAGLITGNALGGRFADRTVTGTVVVILGGLVVSLLALWALGSWLPAVIVLLVLLGGTGFGMVPPLQSYVLQVAGVASALVSALAAAAFNFGVAFGSAVGGGVLARVSDYPVLALVGAGMSALGLVAFLATRPRARVPEERVLEAV